MEKFVALTYITSHKIIVIKQANKIGLLGLAYLNVPLQTWNVQYSKYVAIPTLSHHPYYMGVWFMTEMHAYLRIIHCAVVLFTAF